MLNVEDRKYNDKRYFICFDKLIHLIGNKKSLEEGLKKPLNIIINKL